MMTVTPEMPEIPNTRQERFCRLRVSGLALPEAAISAGYSTTNARYVATALEKRPHITARIAELKETPASLTATITNATPLLSRERVLTEIVLLASEARGAKAWPTVLRCWELLGKDLGMFRDRDEHFEWDGDPNKLSKGQRVKLIAGLREIVSAHAQRRSLTSGELQGAGERDAETTVSVRTDDAGDLTAVAGGGENAAGGIERVRGGSLPDPDGAGERTGDEPNKGLSGAGGGEPDAGDGEDGGSDGSGW